VPASPTPLPRVTLTLMAIFLVGGSLGLLADWPPGPGHVSWGVWLMYGGYLYLIGAALFYARTGK